MHPGLNANDQSNCCILFKEEKDDSKVNSFLCTTDANERCQYSTMLLTRKLLVDCKRFHDSEYKKVEKANQELEISLLKEKGAMEEVDGNGKERFVPLPSDYFGVNYAQTMSTLGLNKVDEAKLEDHNAIFAKPHLGRWSG